MSPSTLDGRADPEVTTAMVWSHLPHEQTSPAASPSAAAAPHPLDNQGSRTQEDFDKAN